MLPSWVKVTIVAIVTVIVCSGCTSLLQPSPTATLALLPTAVPVPSATRSPFSYVSELPKNEFLFIHVDDLDNICVIRFCQCSVLELASTGFEFLDGKLRLHPTLFEPRPMDWSSLRASNNLIALYSDWNPGMSHLQTYSSFPFMTPAGGFSILGVNTKGDIQIRLHGDYVVIPAGTQYTYINAQSDVQSNTCEVLHSYTLHNYGLIADESVEFDDP